MRDKDGLLQSNGNTICVLEVAAMIAKQGPVDRHRPPAIPPEVLASYKLYTRIEGWARRSIYVAAASYIKARILCRVAPKM